MSGAAKNGRPLGWLLFVLIAGTVAVALLWPRSPQTGGEAAVGESRSVPVVAPPPSSDVTAPARVDAPTTALIPPAPSPTTTAGGPLVPPGVGQPPGAVPVPPTAPAPMRGASGGGVAPPAAPDPPVEVTEQDLQALDQLRLSLRDYRTVMGENPTGTNDEITKSLDGGNKKKSRLLPEGAPVNGKGELVDRWGTPYFFHQLSRTDMEVRSAGPDRVLWTGDDVIAQ